MSLPFGADPARWVGSGPARDRCIEVSRNFLDGWRATEGLDRADAVLAALAPFPADVRGFAWEGAGLALGLANADAVLLEVDVALGPIAAAFLHIGRGWARRLGGTPLPADGPFIAWEADGVGFAATVTGATRVLDRALPVPGPPALARWIDHGIGRAAWFVGAGRASVIARLLDRLGPERAVALWHGVGVASAFTGGAPDAEIAALLDRPTGPWMLAGRTLGAAGRDAVAGGPLPSTASGFYVRMV